MSDTDSFINEVTEEVQRDRLYGYVRRYGWLAAILIVGLVGGAAWNEYSKATANSLAEGTGDALLDALELDDIAERPNALLDVKGEGAALAVTALTTAAAQQEAGDLQGAAATLNDLASNGDVPSIYADLAAFKLSLIDTGDDAARRSLLEGLARPGAPFNLLAQEQLAYMDLEAGDQTAAVSILRGIIEDAGVTRGLRDRAQTMIVALGEDLDGSPSQ